MASYRGLIRSLLIFVFVYLMFTVISQRVFEFGEGRTLTFVEGLLFVAETVTSTGFGSFIPFKSLSTMIWSIFLMMAGFITMAVWLGAVIGDWMSTRLSAIPLGRAPRRVREHVIICGTGHITRYLAERCREFRTPAIVVAQDREALVRLMDQGYLVMEGDPRTAAALRRARIGRAAAVVCLLADADNASISLVARSLRPEIPIYASMTSAEEEPYLLAAGVTKTVVIKRSLGLRLGFFASQSQEELFSRLFGQVDGISYLATPVKPGSPVLGNLRRQRLPERTGAVPVGVMSQGRFRATTEPRTEVYPGDLMILAGDRGAISRVRELVQVRERAAVAQTREVLILGFGEVGRGAAEFMMREGIPFRVLGKSLPDPAVRAEKWEGVSWFEGDATRREDLVRAGLWQVGSVVVALPTDADTVYATLIARALHPEVRIIARAHSAEAVERLHLAGADSALDLSAVGGVVLARQILPPDVSPLGLEGLRMAEAEVPPALAGRNLAFRAAEERSRCRLVAVRRAGGALEMAVGDSLRLEAGDRVVLFGTETQQKLFRERVGLVAVGAGSEP